MANAEQSGGAYGDRPEYSELPTPEFEAAKEKLMGLLEHVTFEDVSLRRGLYTYRAGVTHRKYDFIREESEVTGAYPIENVLSIYHQKLPTGGDSYAVRVAWRALPALGSGVFETDYLLEKDSAGPILATMWEMDMGTESFAARAMTPYDVGQLLGDFKVMANSLEAELVERN